MEKTVKGERPASNSGDSTKKARWTPASETSRSRESRYVPTFEKDFELKQRLVGCSSALPKRGKTWFGFTLPKPMGYLQLDANYEHVLKKARKEFGKDSIKHMSYAADPRDDIKAANKAIFDRMMKDYSYCVENFKGVFVDTLTELMDVRKLAEYGRTTQIPQIFYGSIYADFRWMVKHAMDNNASVWFLHRHRKAYVGDTWSGDYELQGWPGVIFDTQVYVEHDRNDKDGVFTTRIVECAQDADLMGMELHSNDKEGNDFPALATKIFTDTDRSDWE